jgi:hypothetical protein
LHRYPSILTSHSPTHKKYAANSPTTAAAAVAIKLKALSHKFTAFEGKIQRKCLCVLLALFASYPSWMSHLATKCKNAKNTLP